MSKRYEIRFISERTDKLLATSGPYTSMRAATQFLSRLGYAPVPRFIPQDRRFSSYVFNNRNVTAYIWKL